MSCGEPWHRRNDESGADRRCRTAPGCPISDYVRHRAHSNNTDRDAGSMPRGGDLMKTTEARSGRTKSRVSKTLCAPEEWKIRVELAACYRLLARSGMSDLTGTHVSALVPGSGKHYLLNPFGLL